jgi:hypothetical protein
MEFLSVHIQGQRFAHGRTNRRSRLECLDCLPEVSRPRPGALVIVTSARPFQQPGPLPNCSSADELFEEEQTMQITLTISDDIVREAGDRGLPVIDFVESLVDKGLAAAKERPVMSSAMERIRALRSSALESKR